jgi:hypothetical protein
MMPHRSLCALAFVVATTFTSAAAYAQERGGELAFGYTFRHLSVDGEGANLPLGFSFSAADRLSRTLSVVAELTESHRSETVGFTSASLNYLTYAGGFRFSKAEPRRARRQAARPFVELLVGGSRLTVGLSGAGSFSGSTFHIEPKGGVDVPMGRSAALRAAVGYENEHASGGWAHALRLDIGAAIDLRRGR